MQYILSAKEMKQCDDITITHFGMPALVLMERAALAAAQEIMLRKSPPSKVLILSGTGNNGGDGFAIGRILMQKGYEVTFCLVGDKARCSLETQHQIMVIEKYGFPIQSKIEIAEYDIIVDALFGIGLSREVSDPYASCIDKINKYKQMRKDCLVCAVDIPSGIHADSGEILGCAVIADITVAFAFPKMGNYLYPGGECAGELIVHDIGITEECFIQSEYPKLFTYDEPISELMPERPAFGHKGTFGKVLLIAGSPGMSGACELSGRACFYCGTGMVKILTHEKNAAILQSNIPEAILETYDALDGLSEKLAAAMDWADCIVMGPGIGKSKIVTQMLHMVMKQSKLPLVLDADGINLISEHEFLQEALRAQKSREIVLTPHIGEYMRLRSAFRFTESQEQILKEQRALAKHLSCVLVCKDARTLVHDGSNKRKHKLKNRDISYINITGNDGMATAGSGDVLAGMMGAFLAQGMNAFEGACLAVYLHGLAGDKAAALKSRYSMMAGDILDAIPRVLTGK